jgi:hypothetical protein
LGILQIAVHIRACQRHDEGDAKRLGDLAGDSARLDSVKGVDDLGAKLSDKLVGVFGQRLCRQHLDSDAQLCQVGCYASGGRHIAADGGQVIGRSKQNTHRRHLINGNKTSGCCAKICGRQILR